MPFQGQLITQGQLEVASSSSELFQIVTVGNGASGDTRGLRRALFADLSVPAPRRE